MDLAVRVTESWVTESRCTCFHLKQYIWLIGLRVKPATSFLNFGKEILSLEIVSIVEANT